MTRFNRICFTIALFWLSITVPAGLILRPTIPDFSQFYTGGTLVSLGKWNALYPTPWRGSLDNAGLHSNGKNDWVLMSARRGAPDYTHFILPPPSALIFVPLSFLTYVQAFWLWTLLLSASVLGVAWISAELLREILGKSSRWEGALMLLIVLSPMTARSIRIANVTPFIALCIAILLRALLRDETYRGGLALVMGILFKYATLVLAPLLLITRRWRLIAWGVALGEVILAITVLIAGTRPFYEYVRIIMPTLSRPSAYLGNQTLAGMLARAYGRPLTPFLAEILSNLRIAALTCVVFALVRLRPPKAQTPVNMLAAAALLISWLLIFSPVAWEHWALFLCPAWGWVLWEAMQPGWRRICAVTSLVLMYFPAGIIQVQGIAAYPIILPEPWNSTQLIGFMLLFALSFSRIYVTEAVLSPAAVSQSQRHDLLNY
jgi:alpha-1,2-mannosyltransferase